MMKNKYTTLKVGIICVVLLLTIALGNGMNKAFAGQDIKSMLMSWFDSKKDSSIEQIDQAITSEKERLIAELREAISAEMERAEAEMAQFTEDEMALRVVMLRNHAADLIAGLDTYDAEEQETITNNLNYALQQGMDLLNGTITELPPVLSPVPGTCNGSSPVIGNGTPSNPEEGEETEGDPEVNETDEIAGEGQEIGKENEPVEESDGEVKVPSQDVVTDEINETPTNEINAEA